MWPDKVCFKQKLSYLQGHRNIKPVRMVIFVKMEALVLMSAKAFTVSAHLDLLEVDVKRTLMSAATILGEACFPKTIP